MQYLKETICNDCKSDFYKYINIFKDFLKLNSSRSLVVNLNDDDNLDIYLSSDKLFKYQLGCLGCECSEQIQVT